MKDWDVELVTDSGQYKRVRVEGYYNQQDAGAAALSQTGAKRIAWIFPAASNQEYETENQTVVENHYYEDNRDYFYEQLDEMEIEMYDLMCQIHMSEGKELPSISEFYDWLES